MTQPSLPHRNEIESVLELVARASRDYFDRLDDLPVRSQNVDETLKAFAEPLPESGEGALDTLRLLLDAGLGSIVNSAGPKFYHFVIGGSTPAALGADWLATTWDQLAYAWVTSPLGVHLEVQSLAWLRDLFALPRGGAGIITTGATMANYVGLASARQWWGEARDHDIAEKGMFGLDPIPVFSSSYIHASSVKCLGMLGIGRASVKTFGSGETGGMDLEALESALKALKGAPCILIANAGEVNAGDFDPILRLAELAETYNGWLHVDGAFGLLARLSPRTAHLVEGVERASSVTVDGHKWLNVPYDCGFSFVREERLMWKTFAYTGAYLPDPEDPYPNLGSIGPEGSRRARSLSVWATLRAYGREGYRGIVERHLDLAERMAARVDEKPDLERLAEVKLNIVCFRYNPGGMQEPELNRLNQALGKAILEDGRVYAGTTTYQGRTALRPTIVNWRTRDADIDLFVDVVQELGQRLTTQM